MGEEHGDGVLCLDGRPATRICSSCMISASTVVGRWLRPYASFPAAQNPCSGSADGDARNRSDAVMLVLNAFTLLRVTARPHYRHYLKQPNYFPCFKALRTCRLEGIRIWPPPLSHGNKCVSATMWIRRWTCLPSLVVRQVSSSLLATLYSLVNAISGRCQGSGVIALDAGWERGLSVSPFSVPNTRPD